MAARKTSIIYESFYEAISDLEEQDFVKMMKAYCDYTFYGKEPELSGYLLAMWRLIRPVLEKNNQLYENGSQGGRPRKEGAASQNQTETKPEPNENQTETKPKPDENQAETKPEPTLYNDLYKDEDKDIDKDKDKDSLSLRSREAPASAVPTEAERENFFRIFFLRNFRNPQDEVDRFIAFYQATGWTRKGQRIIDRVALARSWTEKESTAGPPFPEPFMRCWAEICDVLGPRADCSPLFRELRAVQITPERQIILTARTSTALPDLLERHLATVKPIIEKYYPRHALHYRVPRKTKSQT